MKVIAILNETAKNAYIGSEDIIFVHVHSFVYGVSLEVNVGIPEDIAALEKETKYTLIFEDRKSVVFTLAKKQSATVGDRDLSIYRFVSPIFYKLIHNTIPNTLSFLGVDFKRYIQMKNNQMKYFIFGLRKKALIVINNPDTLEPMETHITRQLGQADRKVTEPYVATKIEDLETKAFNYYSKKDNKTTVTTRGVGQPTYLPQDDDLAINALDNFLIPIYQLKMDLSLYETGDKLTVGGYNVVVMEKDEYHFQGDIQTFVIVGRHSKKDK